MSELKPCPFCGGDGKERLDDESRPGDVRCSLCGSNGPWNMWEDCWNTRPIEDELRRKLSIVSKALQAASNRLNECGYGYRSERESGDFEGLPEQVAAALREIGGDHE